MVPREFHHSDDPATEKTILLAADEHCVRRIIAEALRMQGLNVLEASHSQAYDAGNFVGS
jgi:CheY-like chemotaxis protein